MHLASSFRTFVSRGNKMSSQLRDQLQTIAAKIGHRACSSRSRLLGCQSLVGVDRRDVRVGEEGEAVFHVSRKDGARQCRWIGTEVHEIRRTRSGHVATGPVQRWPSSCRLEHGTSTGRAWGIRSTSTIIKRRLISGSTIWTRGRWRRFARKIVWLLL